MRLVRFVPMTLAALTLGACAAEYAYVPEQNATAQVSGQPAANYAIPPEAPQGDVRIASFGIAPLQANEGETVRALHMRMIVANNSGAPWTVDTREQMLAIGGEGLSKPIFSSTDIGGLPLVQIAPGAKHTIDLFYPLPAGIQKTKQLPAFDLAWRLDAGVGRVVAMRTSFDRVEIQPDYAGYAYDYGPGWWAPYWYDPLYASGTFAHPIVLHQRPVIVRHPPVAVGRAPVVVGRPVAARPVYRR